LSDANAKIEGLLEENQDFYMKRMVEKAPPMLTPNCAVLT